MAIDMISSVGYDLLKVALNATTLRHQAISSNIANSNVKGYQPLRVSFEDQLQGVASKNVTPRIEFDPNTLNVSVDQEMVHMTQNFIHHQALLKALSGKVELMSLAINDGKR
jgi:flagellar basal-body rod protein FlgB